MPGLGVTQVYPTASHHLFTEHCGLTQSGLARLLTPSWHTICQGKMHEGYCWLTDGVARLAAGAGREFPMFICVHLTPGRQAGPVRLLLLVSRLHPHIELVCLILKSPIFVMTTSTTCLCYQALTVSQYFRISERVNTITPPNMYYNTRSVIFHSTAAQLAATPQRIWQNYTAVQSSVVQWWLTVPPITLVTIKLSTFVTLSKFQRTHTTHASHQDRGTWYGSDSRDGCLMIKTI